MQIMINYCLYTIAIMAFQVLFSNNISVPTPVKCTHLEEQARSQKTQGTDLSSLLSSIVSARKGSDEAGRNGSGARRGWMRETHDEKLSHELQGYEGMAETAPSENVHTSLPKCAPASSPAPDNSLPKPFIYCCYGVFWKKEAKQKQ